MSAEPSSLDLPIEVAVRAGDDPGVHRHGLRAARRQDALVFDDLEKLCLQLQRQLTDLVQVERTVARRHEESGVGLHRRREGTAHVAEKLALEQHLRNRAAVDRDEAAVMARAGGVNGAGDQVLPDAAFAGDQHVTRRAGRQRDLLAHGPDRVALPDEREAGGRRLRRPPHEPVFPDRLPILEQALHALLENIDGERLLEVVAGASTKRDDRGFERRVRGHHDDRRARIQHPRSFEHVQAVETRHHDVRDDDVEVLLPDAGQGLFAVPGCRHAIALGRERPGQDVLDRRLVVHEDLRAVQSLPGGKNDTVPRRGRVRTALSRVGRARPRDPAQSCERTCRPAPSRRSRIRARRDLSRTVTG